MSITKCLVGVDTSFQLPAEQISETLILICMQKEPNLVSYRREITLGGWEEVTVGPNSKPVPQPLCD